MRGEQLSHGLILIEYWLTHCRIRLRSCPIRSRSIPGHLPTGTTHLTPRRTLPLWNIQLIIGCSSRGLTLGTEIFSFHGGYSILSASPNGTTTFTSQTLSEEAFAEEMIAYWLSFVRSGNPNTHKLARSPSWPEYHTADTRRLVLTEGSETETGSVVELMSEAEKRRCDFVAGKVLAHEA